jgi:glycosyltransferase involved in cell wall biosynthesis
MSSIKVLYIAHVFENTGYGKACRNYALAMDAAGLDVVIRPVLVNKEKYNNAKIAELCNKSTAGCTHQIQFLLPDYSEYDGRFKKNIFILEKEASHGLNWNGWGRKVNLFDEIWVPNEEHREDLRYENIDRPAYVIPHADEPTLYSGKLDNDELESTYTFYYIGELSRRKNVIALIKAFHLEFSRNEPVSLLLKLNKPGESSESLAKMVTDLCSEIKRGLKLYRDPNMYKREIIITNYLTEEQLGCVHNTGDCFVSCSYGEAWQFPAFDAMAYGNEVIATGAGPKEFLPNGIYHPSSNSTYCFGAVDTLPDLHTAREEWEDVNVRSFGGFMRAAYDRSKNTESEKIRKAVYQNRVKDFSFLNIGNMIKSRLSA